MEARIASALGRYEVGQPITEYVEVPQKWGISGSGQWPQGNELWTFTDENGEVQAVDFRCPCGCGADCYTPVTDATKGKPKTERHWLFSRELDGKVTLSPSIRYTGGCKAHFNITGNKAVMHGDSGK